VRRLAGDGRVTSVKCRWGVIGAGRIARDFVTQFPASRTGTLAAVASTDLARARALAERLGITVPDSVTAVDEASLDIDV